MGEEGRKEGDGWRERDMFVISQVVVKQSWTVCELFTLCMRWKS